MAKQMTEQKTAEALDPMRIWNQVAHTDPKNTKEVKKGRGGYSFTTICAYSQIRQATELWGPVGIGWGWTYRLKYRQFSETTRKGGEKEVWVCRCDLLLYYWDCGERGEITESAAIPVFGAYDVDDEHVKKVVTNAVTKALSRLGFGADVFTGLFDDDRYVQARRAEEAVKNGNGNGQKKPTPAPAAGAGGNGGMSDAERQIVTAYVDTIEKCMATMGFACSTGSRAAMMRVRHEDLAIRVGEMQTREKIYGEMCTVQSTRLAGESQTGKATEAQVAETVLAFLENGAALEYDSHPLKAPVTQWRAWLAEMKEKEAVS